MPDPTPDQKGAQLSSTPPTATASSKQGKKSFSFTAPDFTGFSSAEVLANLDLLMRAYSLLKKPVSVAPTYTPTNFYDSIVYYVNGATDRVYFYTDSWHYAALT